jgi:hypothetical protein
LLRRQFYFSHRLIGAAAILMLLASAGCAMFERETWDLNRFRDERAVDIDGRLDSPAPVVQNPF